MPATVCSPVAPWPAAPSKELLVASPANQFWLTGYDGWSFYTPQMVAVSLKEEEPIWVGRKMDAVGAKFIPTDLSRSALWSAIEKARETIEISTVPVTVSPINSLS